MVLFITISLQRKHKRNIANITIIIEYMAIRDLKIKEHLTPALRTLGNGDTLRVPFKRYSRGFMAKAASETGAIQGKKFTVKTAGQQMYAHIIRTL